MLPLHTYLMGENELEPGESMPEKIHLAINGQLLEADAGSTILQVARQNGIHIPAMCYKKGLKPAESCRVCVVKIEGKPYLHASCGTEVREGMVVTTDSEEIRQIRKLIMDLISKERKAKKKH